MDVGPAFVGATPLIPARDVRQTVDFYVECLGFAAQFATGDPPTYAGVARGRVQIHLFQNDDRYLAEQTSFRIHINRIEPLHEEYQRQGERIPKLTALELKPWGTKEFALIDPNGVCITFYEIQE